MFVSVAYLSLLTQTYTVSNMLSSLCFTNPTIIFPSESCFEIRQEVKQFLHTVGNGFKLYIWINFNKLSLNKFYWLAQGFMKSGASSRWVDKFHQAAGNYSKSLAAYRVNSSCSITQVLPWLIKNLQLWLEVLAHRISTFKHREPKAISRVYSWFLR